MVHYDEYRCHVLDMYRAAVAAVEPKAAVRRGLRREGTTLHITDLAYDLNQGRVFVVSVGKAALPMAAAAVEVLGDTLTAAVVIGKHGVSGPAEPVLSGNPAVQLFSGSHPVSDMDSVQATAVVMQMVSEAGPADLVLCLISGGASALLTQPRIPLADWQVLIQELLASGCTINELNTVRRRLDEVKGGGLAQRAAPARCISLILSDVVGNPPAVIGSGPTVISHDTAQDALDVLDRFDIEHRLPKTTYLRIERSLQETEAAAVIPPVISDVRIVGDVRQAATAALTKAVQLGFVAQILSVHLEGEAREVGRVAAAIAKDTFPGRCFIFGGETTVTMRGAGRGGRNQELALSAVLALEGHAHLVVASLATDGEDGPTSAAGAVVSGETAVCARQHNLVPERFLADNDSFGFFERLDAATAAADTETAVSPCPPTLVTVGSTGTNVNDLLFILTYPHPDSEPHPVGNQTIVTTEDFA
jgi:hydroxypyruvate reductase